MPAGQLSGTGAKRLQLRLTLDTKRKSRTLVLPPIALVFLLGLIPLAGTIFLGATCYFVFHDDLLAGLTEHQIEMQYSYEDRLAQLRHEITNLTQHAKVNETELTERVGALMARQDLLESRHDLRREPRRTRQGSPRLRASLRDRAGFFHRETDRRRTGPDRERSLRPIPRSMAKTPPRPMAARRSPARSRNRSRKNSICGSAISRRRMRSRRPPAASRCSKARTHRLSRPANSITACRSRRASSA